MSVLTVFPVLVYGTCAQRFSATFCYIMYIQFELFPSKFINQLLVFLKVYIPYVFIATNITSINKSLHIPSNLNKYFTVSTGENIPFFQPIIFLITVVSYQVSHCIQAHLMRHMNQFHSLEEGNLVHEEKENIPIGVNAQQVVLNLHERYFR